MRRVGSRPTGGSPGGYSSWLPPELHMVGMVSFQARVSRDATRTRDFVDASRSKVSATRVELTRPLQYISCLWMASEHHGLPLLTVPRTGEDPTAGLQARPSHSAECST